MIKERLKEVLAFVNHKGGVGKTTTVHNLAAGLLRYGSDFSAPDANGQKHCPRILVIDLDPQSCISYLYGWTEEQQLGKPTMYDALVQQSHIPVYKVRDGIYFAPASKRLINIEPFLNQMPVPRKALCKLLAKPLLEVRGTDLHDEGVSNVIDAFDYVLIDCPPAMSLLTHNALVTASGVVLPVQLETLATRGIAEILNAVKETREDLNPELDIRGLLMVMSNDQTKATREFKDFLGEKYSDYLFKSYIRRDTKIVECQAMNEDIFAYSPYCRAGFDYGRFAKEILTTYKE